MDPSKGAPELRFEPPGPGSWELDPVHFPRPVTRYLTETHPEPFRRGVQDFTRFYGMMIDGLEYKFVNGFVYRTVHPVAPEEIPVQFQRAEEVFQKKLWREQLRGLGRDRQAGLDQGAPGAAGSRSRRALRRGVDRLSDPLSSTTTPR